MVRLEISPVLKRPMRRDDLSELGISTVTKALEAINDQHLSEAKELVKYLWVEWRGVHDFYAEWVWALLDQIADRLGEREMYKILKSTLEQRRKKRAEAYLKGGQKEGNWLTAEGLRAHCGGPEGLGDFHIWDDGQVYRVELDPCGSGGKVWRQSAQSALPGTAPFYNRTIKDAYPFTWNKRGVARYCVHCATCEILDIEILGYPLAIHEFPEDPQQPCRWIIYKDPKAIPAEYFTRVGKSPEHT